MTQKLYTVESKYGYEETIDRFIAALEKRHMVVFTRVDHAELAHSVGLALRPMEVFFFGSPKAGAPLMQDKQTIGIDLPLKVLIWEDEAHRIQFSYNDLDFVADRHGMSAGSRQVISGVSKAIAEISEEIAQD
jgi:uncharacterized protein (DUF302 family)